MKGGLHPRSHGSIIVRAAVLRLSRLTALVAFWSHASPASVFSPRFYVCTTLCALAGVLPVVLNSGSCQGRCSSEYVQHVLQAKRQLPKHCKDQSSISEAAKHAQKAAAPLKRARNRGSPTGFATLATPLKSNSGKKCGRRLVCSPSPSCSTGSV